MLDGLAYIATQALGRQKVLVLGESELITTFMLRKSKPSLRELVLRVQKAHE